MAELLCGDATVATDVERVLGGVQPNVMVTDPPYGVNYDPEWRNAAKFGDRSDLGEGHVGIGELDHNDDRTPRGHRERHARQEWSAKARNHSRVA